MFPSAEHFLTSLIYIFLWCKRLYPLQVNLFTPYLDELPGQCDNNIPACFVFPLQKFWIMLKEICSLWVNQMILWWYQIKGIAALLLKVVNSGKWTFTIILHPAVFQYLSHGKLSSVNHESTLKGAALKVNN